MIGSWLWARPTPEKWTNYMICQFISSKYPPVQTPPWLRKFSTMYKMLDIRASHSISKLCAWINFTEWLILKSFCYAIFLQNPFTAEKASLFTKSLLCFSCPRNNSFFSLSYFLSESLMQQQSGVGQQRGGSSSSSSGLIPTSGGDHAGGIGGGSAPNSGKRCWSL